MDTQTLVATTTTTFSFEKVDAGEELIRRLDAMNFNVVAALWYYSPELNQWRLIIASPKVDEQGPKKAYKAVKVALEKKPNRIKAITLQEINLSNPKHPDVVALRSVFQMEDKRGFAKIRLQSIVVNNVVIEDAFIYRL